MKYGMAGCQRAAWFPTDCSYAMKHDGVRTQVDSFFNFFSPPEIPTEEVDDDEMAELQETLEADYELGYA